MNRMYKEKRKNLIGTFILLSMGLAGCSEYERQLTEEVQGEPVPLTVISATVVNEEGRGNGDVKTRAANPVSLENGDQIGAFLTAGSGKYTNTCYIRDSEIWGPKTPEDRSSLLGAGTVCGYYPWGATFTSTDFSLTPQLYTGENDICFATSQAIDDRTGQAPVAFEMKRAYAMLELDIVRSTTQDDALLTALKLENGMLPALRSLDITTGTYGTLTTAAELVFPELSISLPRSITTPLKILLPPCEVLDSSGLKVTFILYGKYLSFTVPTNGVMNKFEAGKCYKVTVNANGTYYVVGEVTLADWSLQDMDNGGTGYVPLS